MRGVRLNPWTKQGSYGSWNWYSCIKGRASNANLCFLVSVHSKKCFFLFFLSPCIEFLFRSRIINWWPSLLENTLIQSYFLSAAWDQFLFISHMNSVLFLLLYVGLLSHSSTTFFIFDESHFLKAQILIYHSLA